MSTAPLPLTPVVDVTVEVSSQSAIAPSFNLGLIVGTSPVIPNATRVMQFQSLAAMVAAGYSTTSPEYLAAQLYLGQAPAPQFVYVGLQDTTAVAAVAVDTSAEGTGYVVGDLLSIVQGAASGATVRVTTIGSSGAVTGVQLVSQGTGYTVATGLATTGGTGTGAEVSISAIGETCVQAVTACRTASSNWYAAFVCNAAKADHLAVAGYIEAAPVPSTYFFSTQDAAVPAGTAGNVFLELQTLEYNRTIGLYSTAQNGSFPNNVYAGAALMGVAMGLNTGLPGSYYILKFKQLAGVSVEPLTQTQVSNIENANGNVYLLRGQSSNSTFQIVEQGVMASGLYWYQTVNRDMLAANIQINIMNVLATQLAVMQTNADQQLLLNAANAALTTSANIGYISPGTWTGITLLNLSSGTALPSGFLAQSAGYVTQSPANRAAGQAMPILIALIESGGVQSVSVAVNVQI